MVDEQSKRLLPQSTQCHRHHHHHKHHHRRRHSHHHAPTESPLLQLLLRLHLVRRCPRLRLWFFPPRQHHRHHHHHHHNQSHYSRGVRAMPCHSGRRKKSKKQRYPPQPPLLLPPYRVTPRPVVERVVPHEHFVRIVSQTLPPPIIVVIPRPPLLRP